VLVRLGSRRIDVLHKFISFHILYVCGGAVLEAAHISDRVSDVSAIVWYVCFRVQTHFGFWSRTHTLIIILFCM